MNLINTEMGTVAQNCCTELILNQFNWLIKYNNSYENHSALFSDTTASLCIYQYSEIKYLQPHLLLCKVMNKIFL